MRKRHVSRLISTKQTADLLAPNTTASSGMWNMSDVYAERKAGSWSISTPPPFVIFDSTTTPNSSATGGWYSVLAGGGSSPVLSIGSTSLALRAPYWCDGDAYTNNSINFSNAKSMTIVVSASGVTSSYFYSHIGWPTTSGEQTYSLGSPSNANFGQTTITIPILNGSTGKIRFRVTNSDGGYVYLYSIVLNY